MKHQYLDVLGPKDIETAFRAASKGRADAVLVLAAPSPILIESRLSNFAIKNRLPAIYPIGTICRRRRADDLRREIADLYRRAATYVDKILKGRMPADLPVEQPMKFDFIVSLKAAKQIGVTIPPNVLVRADPGLDWGARQ